MNRDHSVIFEIALKYCISDSGISDWFYSLDIFISAGKDRETMRKEKRRKLDEIIIFICGLWVHK